jgi:hypothetical protein
MGEPTENPLRDLARSGEVTDYVAELVDDQTTVPSPGTPVPVRDTPYYVRAVAFTALETNSGTCVVGGPNVRAHPSGRRGIPLNAGETIVYDGVDLNRMYVDATAVNDGVSWTAAR